ncbi:DUF1028 domain-containing protein [candidate division KSB1 bacterium]|nr:DUF1028 domain-containing protein [candidate division KSB1 bacterium]RQW04585.1 MAG: DUF1028 domain-containing protein [candidate division KSB1 bacterium]
MRSLILLLLSAGLVLPVAATDDVHDIATFSIVGCDPDAGELGVAVASRFFAVGSVVPWAKAGVGAVATQSFANTSFGWRGLDLLEKGIAPAEAMAMLLKSDDHSARRQVGIVAADGRSATFTGDSCNAWAGGRHGENYACQGNILTGEDVVAAMEEVFLNTTGALAERLYAALLAGDAKGGDARGKQSAALLVVREGAGYGGYTDRAIDIRVDDHLAPLQELGRLLALAQLNDAWNEAWTLFSAGKSGEALPFMDRAMRIDPTHPEVLYDLAVIRLAAGDTAGALEALAKAIALNPGLKNQARVDDDLAALRGKDEFEQIVR